MEVVYGNTTAVLQNVTFGKYFAPSLNQAVLRVGALAFAVLYSTVFPDQDIRPDINPQNGSVYADRPESFSALYPSRWPVLPTSQIPNNLTFLREDDPELRQIKQV